MTLSLRSPRHARKPLLRRVAIGAAVLVALLALAVFLVDWEDLARSYAERRLEAATGREVRLERLEIRPRLPLQLELHGLSVANPSWARHDTLFSVGTASFSIRLLPLIFRREVVLPSVVLVRPEIALERSEGRASWTFAEGEETGGGAGLQPQVHALRVDRAVLRYLDPDAGTDLDVRADERPGEQGTPRLAFRGKGRYEGETVDVEGAGDSLLLLRNAEQPYRLRAKGSVGKTRVQVQGEVLNPVQLEAVDIEGSIEGATLAHLYKLLRVALPDTPPYRLEGRLQRAGGVWRSERFAGRLGDSDLSGSLSFDARQQPPLLEAKLKSKLLDLDDLGPLIGAPPKTGPGETASAQQKRMAEKEKQDPTVLPDKGFRTERWGTLNARVSLDAKRIERPKQLPIDDLHAELTLQDGVIRLEPLRFGIAGGDIVSTIALDGRQDPLRVDLDASVKALRLDRLFPTVETTRGSIGKLYGHAALKGRGDSVRAMLASSNGEIRLVMTPGAVSNLLLEAAGLDAGEILRFVATGDRLVKVECTISNFEVKDGVARARAVAIATEDSNIAGTGLIDLKNEQLDLTFYVTPKDISVLVARAPLHVRGTFKKPRVLPDTKVVAGRAIAAVLLGLVNPVLAVVPLIETGPGKDSTCAELVGAARGWRSIQAASETDKTGGQGGRGSNEPPNAPRAETRLKPRAEQRKDTEIAPRVEDLPSGRRAHGRE
jgi:uncharacterized protein involved in outer membrane biogenesis